VQLKESGPYNEVTMKKGERGYLAKKPLEGAIHISPLNALWGNRERDKYGH